MPIKAYAGNVFFCKEAAVLVRWSREEENRVKASRLHSMALEKEYAWRKNQNDQYSLPTEPLPPGMILREELPPPAAQRPRQ